MGKDILTPNKIQTYAERDYSTPKAHCDLSVLQEAEEKNSLSKINTEHDPEYIALLNEKSKMQQEGVLANRKPPSEKPLEREVIETFLINREFKIDEKIRTNKEKKYPIDVHLLRKICSMHPIVKNVHKLVSVCSFNKKVYSRLSTSKTSARKSINKEMMIKIADILELDDWRILIDREELDALSKKEARIKKIKEDMKDYRSKIQDLQKELKKQGVKDD